jgi:hypothetical protein
MKPIKTYYTVWYYRENWGTGYATVKAHDVVQAIALVRAPLVEKYGDDIVWYVTRVENRDYAEQGT